MQKFKQNNAAAQKKRKPIDGHAPELTGVGKKAYAARESVPIRYDTMHKPQAKLHLE
jgi:hypothetical protein